MAVSRHGLLPFVIRSPLAPHPFQADLNASLLACDGVGPMLRLIREAFADVPGGLARGDRRHATDQCAALARAHRAQRRQFMRHVRWLWEASRHRTAPASYEAVEALRETGRLQVHAARVLSVRGNGPLEVSYAVAAHS